MRNLISQVDSMVKATESELKGSSENASHSVSKKSVSRLSKIDSSPSRSSNIYIAEGNIEIANLRDSHVNKTVHLSPLGEQGNFN